jgi:hypothetical protein
MHALACEIIKACPNKIYDVKTTNFCHVAQNVSVILRRYKHAMTHIEDIALSPYTLVGKKRLLNDFRALGSFEPFELVI